MVHNALFLRDRAIHLICWTPAVEIGDRFDPFGFRTVNQPIDYWLTYARNAGGDRTALIVAQTQSDKVADDVEWDTKRKKEIGQGFGEFSRFIPTSAKTGRGIAELRQAIFDAAGWVQANFGRARIGHSWALIESELERLRQEDMAREPHARKHRVISEEEFQRIASECGLKRGYDTVLHYLNAIGVVFWDQNLFSGRIILDQAWALEAIYAVFDRASCVAKLRAQRGRFTEDDLANWLWDEQSHSRRDQNLFISFMVSCRICFPYYSERGEQVYIAPDALPAESALAGAIALEWNENLRTHEITRRYDLLHDGLLRGIMCRIGRDAGYAATYWRSGFQLFDRRTKCRLRLTQHKTAGWAGFIRIMIQQDPAHRSFEDKSFESVPEDDDFEASIKPEALLAGRINKLLESEEIRCGLKSIKVEGVPSEAEKVESTDVTSVTAPALDPAAKRGYFISYAWADTDQSSCHHTDVINQFCTAAAERGVSVNIDRDQMRPGDSISAYMDRLAHGDRIFVFLSESYLYSVACMTELTNAWNYSDRRWAEFQRRVKFYVLPATTIFSAEGRATLKAYWFEKWSAIKSEYEKIDPTVMARAGSPEKLEIDSMGAILNVVPELSAEIADHLHEPNFSRFCETWLHDLQRETGTN